MQHIGTQLKQVEKKGMPKNGINSERADVVAQLVLFMGHGNERFKYWLGRTRKLTPGEIFGMMKAAREGRRPRALFEFLLKKRLSTHTLDTPA